MKIRLSEFIMFFLLITFLSFIDLYAFVVINLIGGALLLTSFKYSLKYLINFIVATSIYILIFLSPLVKYISLYIYLDYSYEGLINAKYFFIGQLLTWTTLYVFIKNRKFEYLYGRNVEKLIVNKLN